MEKETFHVGLCHRWRFEGWLRRAMETDPTVTARSDGRFFERTYWVTGGFVSVETLRRLVLEAGADA